MTNLIKFLSLSNFERLLLGQAFFLLLFTSISLKFFGIKRQPLISIQGNNTHPSSRYEENSSLVLAITRMVKIAVRYSPFSASCLAQSLVLLKLLKNQGIVAQLRIGVQKAADQIKAHAWVELQGVVLNDTNDIHSLYIPFNNPISF